MDVKYLRKNEIIHEIIVRKFELKGDEEVAELRSILRQLIKNEVPLSNEIFTYDQEQEDEIAATVNDISDLVKKYPGKDAKSLKTRVNTLINHVIERIHRYDTSEEATAKTLNEFRESCIRDRARLEAHEKKLVKSLCSTFLSASDEDHDNDNDDDDKSSSNSEEFNLPLLTSQKVLKPRESNKRFMERVSVYKWGVTFKGNEKPEGVMTFLERVEELRVARNVSKSKLFTTAIDLFSGDAVPWYRSARGKVNSWDELITELKLDFLPADFDDIVWEEIRSRRQFKGEKISIYLAIMENLFSRLTVLPEEKIRLKTIRKQMLPVYVARLSLSEINSVRELADLCRKIESTLSFPDKKSSEGGGQINRVNAINVKRESYKCWNCDKEGHRFSSCTRALGKFCFRCGLVNQTARTCSRCNNSSKN